MCLFVLFFCRLLHMREYPDYKYRPRSRKAGGGGSATPNSQRSSPTNDVRRRASPTFGGQTSSSYLSSSLSAANESPVKNCVQLRTSKFKIGAFSAKSIDPSRFSTRLVIDSKFKASIKAAQSAGSGSSSTSLTSGMKFTPVFKYPAVRVMTSNDVRMTSSSAQETPVVYTTSSHVTTLPNQRSVLKGSLENIVVKQEPIAAMPLEQVTALQGHQNSVTTLPQVSHSQGFQAIAKWESDCKVFDLVEAASNVVVQPAHPTNPATTTLEFKEEPMDQHFSEPFASPAPSNPQDPCGPGSDGLLDGILTDLEDLEGSLSGSSDLFPDIGNFVAGSTSRAFSTQMSSNSSTFGSTGSSSTSSGSDEGAAALSSVFHTPDASDDIDTLFSGLDNFEDANAMETWIKTH